MNQILVKLINGDLKSFEFKFIKIKDLIEINTYLNSSKELNSLSFILFCKIMIKKLYGLSELFFNEITNEELLNFIYYLFQFENRSKEEQQRIISIAIGLNIISICNLQNRLKQFGFDLNISDFKDLNLFEYLDLYNATNQIERTQKKEESLERTKKLNQINRI